MAGSGETASGSDAAAQGGTPKGQAARSPRKRLNISRRRLWLFRCCALIIVPLVLLLVLEGGLRLVGYGYPTGFAVRRSLGEQPAYVPNPAFARRFFPPGLGRTAVPFAIPADKPEKTCRVFVLGGSAARGTPKPAFGFARILEAQLRHRYPGVDFEVINAAIVAINSHVVLEIAKDCAELEPDLFVVYVGNNEVVGPFGAGTVLTTVAPSLGVIRAGLALRTTRTGQMLGDLLAIGRGSNPPPRWGGMTMFLKNQVPADAEALQTVYQNFERNLEDLCDVAAENGVPMVLSTVGSNLKDCPPFASLHRTGLTEPEKRQWEEITAKGVANEEAERFEAAIEFYLSAAEIDDAYADLHFRLGRCYWASGDFAAASERFIQARQRDTLRFRADTRINEIVRRVAERKAESGVYLADFVAAAEENSPHATLGEELFHEHVHLNFAGNHLLALTVLMQAGQALPTWVQQEQDDFLSEEACARELAFTTWDRYQVVDEVLSSFVKGPPFTNQLYHDEFTRKLSQRVAEYQGALFGDPRALDEVNQTYRQAIERNDQDVWLRFNYAAFLSTAAENHEAAERQLRMCVNALPDDPDILNELGMTLARQEEYAEACEVFRRALSINPRDIEVRSNLATSLAQAGEFDAAFEQFDAAIQQDPDDATTCYSAAVARTSQGDLEQATALYRRAIELDPGLVVAHGGLAKVLLAQGQAEEAIRHLRGLLKVNASDAETRLRLGVALSSTGQAGEAVEHLRQVVALRPGWAEASAELAWVLATSKDATVRRGEEAVALAETACAMDGYSDPVLLDILAAAYAEAGRFSDAVSMARQALGLCSGANAALGGEVQKRLGLYESEKPYRGQRVQRP